MVADAERPLWIKVHFGRTVKQDSHLSAELFAEWVTEGAVFVDTNTLPGCDRLEHVRLAQIFSAFGVDLNLFNSEHCRNMLLENVQQIISREYSENLPPMKTLVFGIIDPARYERLQQPRHDHLAFIYNHRLENYKNWQTTFDVLNGLYQESPTFKVYVTGVDGKHLTRLNPYPFVVFRTDLTDPDDYLTFMSKCHINTTNSQHETYCMSAVESLGMGQILVAPNAVTFPELVPEGYPYLFNSVAEQTSMLRQLIKDWPNVPAGYAPATRDRFSISAYVGRLATLFGDMAGQRTAEILAVMKHREQIETSVKALPPTMTFTAAYKAMQAITNLGPQVLTPIRVKRVLNAFGYSDPWQRNQIVLSK